MLSVENLFCLHKWFFSKEVNNFSNHTQTILNGMANVKINHFDYNFDVNNANLENFLHS